MEKRKPFGVRLDEKLQVRLKCFCVKNSITFESFIKEAVINYLDSKGRYAKPNNQK